MALIVIVIILLAITWVPKIRDFYEYRKKYPIIGDKIPKQILKRGDKVIFKNGIEYCFQGRDSVNYDFVFQNDYSVNDIIFTRQQLFDMAVAIKNEYGYKWIKSNYNLTNSTCL